MASVQFHPDGSLAGVSGDANDVEKMLDALMRVAAGTPGSSKEGKSSRASASPFADQLRRARARDTADARKQEVARRATARREVGIKVGNKKVVSPGQDELRHARARDAARRARNKAEDEFFASLPTYELHKTTSYKQRPTTLIVAPTRRRALSYGTKHGYLFAVCRAATPDVLRGRNARIVAVDVAEWPKSAYNALTVLASQGSAEVLRATTTRGSREDRATG